jgi:hypothetical protein
VSTPTDSPSAAADRDPVQEARDHLEQALAALDRLRDVLPPTSSTPPSDTGGGEPA